MSRKRSMRALSPMFVTLPSTWSETRNRLRSHHSRLRFKADLTQGRDDVEEMLGGKLPPILPLHASSRKQHDRAGLPALSGLVNGFGPTGGDRKSVVLGKSVSVCVDLGGRRSIKEKKKHNK